ncbi:MAG: hypothetical protein NUV56_01385 [Candidatus Uhrbacteria bacterium]|nr:hypothetical protein [Candidatus Uhrbacteria bacterium]
MFLLTFMFWMFAGCILIFPVILTTISASELFSARYDETPELFMSLAFIPFVKQLAVLLVALIVAGLAFYTGQRNREVVLRDDGTVQVRWGKKVPVTLRCINAAMLKDFAVTKEARFAMNARSSGHYGFRNMPDRWRLKATANGRAVNLGSYATEDEARQAIAAMQAAGRKA